MITSDIIFVYKGYNLYIRGKENNLFEKKNSFV